MTEYDFHAGRNVLYPDAASQLALGRWAYPIIKLFRKAYLKIPSAIGHSWFHRGAERFVEFLTTSVGLTSDQHEELYCASLDIASWDSTISHQLIDAAKETTVDFL